MDYYVADAFTDRLFAGNPAGVCIADNLIDDELMQSIAEENNLSETAFVFRNHGESGCYGLRWFTPKAEVDLCGHATLAAAHVMFNVLHECAGTVKFDTKSGILTITEKDGLLEMDFPSRPPREIEITPQIKNAISKPIKEAYAARDLIIMFENEQQVRDFIPNFEMLENITDYLGIIVTAKGDKYDFVSRFFAPSAGVPEDPVTGSAHSSLIPFWSRRLGKKKLTAFQLSKRGGLLHCEDCGRRVKISGSAILYMKGTILL